MTIAAAGALAACGGGGSASPALLHAPPRSYLLGSGDLVAPGFAADVAPHDLSADDLAGGTAGIAAALRQAGLSAAAGADYFRDAGDFAEANGPVQVGQTVEEFAGIAGAHSAFVAGVSRLDGVTGSLVVATGALGDEAHATHRSALLGSSTAVEFTLEWRVANLVNVLVVRGRDGATRLSDGLLLANRQTAIELGRHTPSPPPTASAATSVSSP